MPVKKFAFTLYYIGLLLLAVSLPLWMLLMSISQMIILAAWIIDGDIKNKLKRAFSNPVIVVLTGVYLLHLAGLFYTSDFDFAIHDLRIKVPLLLLPVIIFSMPRLSSIQFNNVLKAVIAGSLFSSFCAVTILTGVTSIVVDDIRDISIFISHIRLSLIVCVAVLSAVYLAKQPNTNKIIYGFVIAWFIVFLLILESLTGIAVMMAMLCIYLISRIWKCKFSFSRAISAFCFLLIAGSGLLLFKYLFVDSVKPVFPAPGEMKLLTLRGNPYVHLTDKQDIENGQLVWINICERELDSAWNRRSNIDYSGRDLRNQELKFTLIRFLTSRHFPKDASGVEMLSDADIASIENGIANYLYTNKSSPVARFQKLAWEYRNYYYNGDPSGHSAMQRIEFWKTAIYIIKKHPYAGVGTGDVQAAFNKAYEEMHSRLLPSVRFRAHNEYLTMFVTFGIAGGLYFIFSLLFPFFYLRKKGDFLYVGFFIILLVSMLVEDTPETQAGATFMALFNAFFLFHGNNEKTNS